MLGSIAPSSPVAMVLFGASLAGSAWATNAASMEGPRLKVFRFLAGWLAGVALLTMFFGALAPAFVADHAEPYLYRALLGTGILGGATVLVAPHDHFRWGVWTAVALVALPAYAPPPWLRYLALHAHLLIFCLSFCFVVRERQQTPGRRVCRPAVVLIGLYLAHAAGMLFPL